jgi:hypothetical protein
MKALALVILLAIAATAGSRRSEPRDQDSAQRHHVGTAAYCATCERGTNGRIRRPARVPAAPSMPATGSTAGSCPGYVVDHVVRLKRGGPDDPTNMQWQSVEDAKAKDRIE